MAFLLIAAVAFAAFAPAQATNDTPIYVVCTGTAGYEGTSWKARQRNLEASIFGVPVCVTVVADNLNSLSPPSDPPPFDPLKPDNYLWWLLDWSNTWDPAPLTHLSLTGAGDFACGDGSLTSTSDSPNIVNAYDARVWNIWQLDWTATFSHGVGNISGTATHSIAGQGPTGDVRTLSGTIFVADGGQTPLCDDSAGASPFLAGLTLS